MRVGRGAGAWGSEGSDSMTHTMTAMSSRMCSHALACSCTAANTRRGLEHWVDERHAGRAHGGGGRKGPHALPRLMGQPIGAASGSGAPAGSRREGRSHAAALNARRQGGRLAGRRACISCSWRARLRRRLIA